MLSKPRILFVEDESGIADTLQYVLASDGFEPVGCGTAAQALAAFAQAAPALVLLDVGLPDLNGFELFKRLQALPGGAAVPVLFLTARSAEIDRVVGLELGAHDYIAKPFSPRELVARVRGVLRRSGQLPAQAHERTTEPVTDPALDPTIDSVFKPPPGRAFALDEERRQIRYYGCLLALSRYEYGLLRVLVQRPGRVFTRGDLLALVWEEGSDSYDRTVDAHIKTLRAKLKAIAPLVDAIRTSRGTGYALAEDLPVNAAAKG